MQIKNKLEKVLITITGLLVMALIVLGIKLKDDNQKFSAAQDDLNNFGSSIQNALDMQKQIMASRGDLLDKIVAAPAPDTTKAVTTQVVVPGKVVPQKVPVTSTKKTKTS